VVSSDASTGKAVKDMDTPACNSIVTCYLECYDTVQMRRHTAHEFGTALHAQLQTGLGASALRNGSVAFAIMQDSVLCAAVC
jgi:hypothetical protein